MHDKVSLAAPVVLPCCKSIKCRVIINIINPVCECEKQHVQHAVVVPLNPVSTVQADGCVGIGENDEIDSLTMGRICSFYYLKHQTMGLFATTLKPEMGLKQVHSPCTAYAFVLCIN